MNRSSEIRRRSSMAENRFRTEVSPYPSWPSSLILALRAGSVKISAGSLTHCCSKKNSMLLAEPFDIEGAARGEQFQVLDLLVRTGELAGAAGASAFLASRGFLAHHIGVQRARTFLRKLIRLRVARAFVEHHVHHLRNDISGALD